jgi:OmpA-OmpF porin, OOP family
MQRTYFLSILAAGLMCAFPAHAQWYVGAGGGQTDARLSEGAQASGRFLAQGFDSASVATDKRDAGYRVFGGYGFHPNLAVELGYSDLGEYRIQTAATAGIGGPGALRNDIRIDGVDLSLVASLPVGERGTVFGRIGAFSAEARSSVNASGSVTLFDADDAAYKKRETKGLLGLGAQFRVTSAVSIRGEWMRFDKVKTVDAAGNPQDADVDLYAVSVVYRF